MKTRDVLLLAVVVFAATYLGNSLGKVSTVEAAPAKQDKKYMVAIGGAKKPTQKPVWEYKVLYLHGSLLKNGLCANTTFNPLIRKAYEEVDSEGGDMQHRLEKFIEVSKGLKESGAQEENALTQEGKDGWEYVAHQVALSDPAGEVLSCKLEVVFKRPAN